MERQQRANVREEIQLAANQTLRRIKVPGINEQISAGKDCSSLLPFSVIAQWGNDLPTYLRASVSCVSFMRNIIKGLIKLLSQTALRQEFTSRTNSFLSNTFIPSLIQLSDSGLYAYSFLYARSSEAPYRCRGGQKKLQSRTPVLHLKMQELHSLAPYRYRGSAATDSQVTCVTVRRKESETRWTSYKRGCSHRNCR